MTQRRRVLITGASGALGAAVTELMAADADLWLAHGRARDAAADLASRLGAVRVSELELRSPASIDALWREVDERWGSLHAVVNNAGVCPVSRVEEISVEEWDGVLETNARGTFLMCHAALPALRAARGDRAIVNVASLAGQVGSIHSAVHYAASKAAVLAITRSLARDLGPEGIRVNAVSPGPLVGRITDAFGDGRGELEAAAPLGRLGATAEVAPTIALLASPASAFTTGATYDVNGGLRMG